MDKTLLKFWYIFSTIVIVGMFGFLLQTAWWIWYPYDIVRFEEFCCSEDGSYFNGFVLNENKTVKRGDVLHVKIKFNKKYDLTAYNVVRQLVNDRYITLVCNDAGTLPMGEQEKIFSIFIPLNIFPGKYKLINNFVYHPNIFRTVPETWISEWFEVIHE
jgi:hypothetical protein